MLKVDVVSKLEAQFDENRVKMKQVRGRDPAPYLESYDVINKANEIFGYGGWGTEILGVEIEETGGKTLCIARLALSVDGSLTHQDVGVMVAAQSKGKALSPDALEMAVKGAVSDALKRTLRHFGKQFGNDLYDKARSGNGQKAARPQRSATSSSKPQGRQGGNGQGRVSNDPMSRLWAFAREHKLDKEIVDQSLEKVSGDASKALVLLKERCEDL